MNRSYPFYINLFLAFMLITLLTTGVIYFYTTKQFHNFYQEQVEKELEVRASIFEQSLSDSVDASLAEFVNQIGKSTNTRFTIIEKNGLVIADSKKDKSSMSNHRDRPEIMAAFSGQKGMAVRYSETMKTEFMYVAIPVSINKNIVVRTSLSLNSFDKILVEYKQKMLQIIMITIFLGILLSLLLTKLISKPLEQLKTRALMIGDGPLQSSPIKSNIKEIAELNEIIEESSKNISQQFDSIKSHKERLSAVLDGMIEGVIAIDVDEKIILINGAAKKMLNIQEENVEGVWLRQLVRNINFQQMTVDLLEKKQDLDDFLDIPIGSDVHNFSINGRILERSNNCGLIVLHDITEVKRLENLRRDFASNVSHEFRTPLTSLKGFVETLLDGAMNDPDDTKHFLEIMNQQADKLILLIEDLLTISKLEKDDENKGIEFSVQNISSVVINAIEACSSRAVKKNILVKSHISSEDINAKINSSLLEQAVQNLIDNAIKYSIENGTVLIDVYDVNDEVVLSVTDNGIGIPSRHFPRLFERFYRVDKSRNSKISGTGLGLSIVKHILSIHNGRVEVESLINKGSTFTIYLPKYTKEN